MIDATECELYQAAIRGDRTAFEIVIRTHSRALFAIAYAILGSREEAEDVVQEALIKAWKSRWRVRDPEKFVAWLCTIARHRARDVLRKRKPEALPQSNLEGPALSCPTSSTDATTLDRELHSALAALPETHRTAVALRYFEEMDYASIEKLLGLTNGALRGILGRALAMLRKQLKPALASLD